MNGPFSQKGTNNGKDMAVRGGRGRGGREGGREGVREGRRDDCYTYYNGPQYLNSNHVTYYVVTCKSAFDWVYAEQWYVIITSDVTWTQ